MAAIIVSFSRPTKLAKQTACHFALNVPVIAVVAIMVFTRNPELHAVAKRQASLIGQQPWKLLNVATVEPELQKDGTKCYQTP